jgi:creatinine amidohydrolase/Fe(II)-dependent formamide hydrolase-like protein
MERDFIRQIARTLLEIHLYGFARILLLPGHGPMPRACPKAEEIYRQNVRRRKALGSPAKTMTWMYSEAAKEAEPLLGKLWIHADKTESSLVMALCEGLMRLDLLPGDRRQIVAAYLGEPYITETQGYNPARKELWPAFDALDPRNADAEYGRRIVECVLNRMGRIVAEFVS